MEELQPEELEGLVQELEQETEVRTKEGSPPASDEAEQHLARAFTLEEDGEYEKALEACDLALRLEPTLADAHNLRDVALEELGREEEAVLGYREALRLDPGFDAAKENLLAVEAELAARGRSPLPQKLLCTGQTADSRHCPHHAIYKCQTCDALLCHDHARFFQPSGGDPSQRAYVGTYCDRHHQKLEAALVGELRWMRIVSRLLTSYSWLCGLAYLPVFLGTIYLMFTVDGEWPVWVAGVVWLVGGLLGLIILAQKGSTALDRFESAIDKLQGCGGEAVLLALALLGPFVLLASLLARSRDSDAARLDMVVEGGEHSVQTTETAQPTPISRLKGEMGSGERQQGPVTPEEPSAPGEDAEVAVTATSVPVDHEAPLKRGWFLVGILASVVAYVAGVLVCGYLVQPWSLTLSEYLAIVYDMYLGLSLCCGLPGLALSLFVLWVVAFKATRPKKWAVVAIVIVCVIANLVIGCGAGMFNMLDLSRY